MRVEATSWAFPKHNDKPVVIGVWQDESLAGIAAEIDKAAGGAISRLLECEEISAKRLAVSTLLTLPNFPAPVVVIGLGRREEAKPELAMQAASCGAKALATKLRKSAVFCLELDPVPSAICGSMLGCVGQGIAKQEPKIYPIEEVLWATADTDDVHQGVILGECVNATRRLVNLPANQVYPVALADECQRVCGQHGIEIEIWDESRLQAERCETLLAVGRGSSRESRLVIMRYRGGTADQAPLGLVGKGVTFDSGGLSLKPRDSMVDMRLDMAGAATVLGALQAIVRLKLPVNVVGLVGLVENMVSQDCLRPGDVLTARSGKTIEVQNTDAEGRLVLADVLDVAVEQGIGRLVDLATLTGACVVALGQNTVGLMSNDQAWASQVMQAARVTGEQIWQLPMFEEFAEQIKSRVADIKNMGEGRWGGTMAAAKFLEEFVKDVPWVHLDIAGPAFNEKRKPWLDAGASGCMVRTLVELARTYPTAL